MIKLKKSPEPAVLTNSAATWTKEYLEEIAKLGDKAKAKPSRYGHPDVKAALMKETNEKCAYCESKFAHIAYGDVEHIVGKKVEPELAYDWKNLTIACDRCNTNKADKVGLVDPYEDDPAAAFKYHGPWMTNNFGSEIGKLTLLVIQLNRTQLLEKRKEKLDALKSQIESVISTKNNSIRTLLLDTLVQQATSADAEYSACLTSFIEDLRLNGFI